MKKGKIVVFFLISIASAVLIALFLYEQFGAAIIEKTYYYEDSEYVRKWMCICLWKAGKYIMIGAAVLTAIIYGFAIARYANSLILNVIVSAVLSAIGGAAIIAILLFIWWIGVLLDTIGFLIFLGLVVFPFIALVGGCGDPGEVVRGIFIWFD